MNDSSQPAGPLKYERVCIGGGGYVTGMRIAGMGANKVRVCRTDTAGAFIWSERAQSWQPLLQVGINISERLVKYNYARGAGCYDVVTAPSATNHIYVCQFGYVYHSADRGSSWSRTSLPAFAGYGANSRSRATNERMAVDPANHLIVGLGNPDIGAQGGLKYTLDGGISWTSRQDIPAPTEVDRGMAVAFDPESSVPGRKTATVYVWSFGHGIYRSSTGIDGSFALIDGSPVDIGHMVARLGALWVGGTSGGASAPLRKWTERTGWNAVSGVGDCKHIAISPDGRKIVSMIPSSAYRMSKDGGESFSPLTPRMKRQAVHIGWHETTNENYMSNGACVWDTEEDILYIAEGIGCWKCISPPADGSIPTYLEDSVGIENLVSMQILVPPQNSRIHYVSQDRNVITREWWQYKLFPNHVGVSNSVPIDHGGGIDFAAGDENYLAVVSSKNGRCNISTDGGASWQPVSSVPANVLPTPPQTGSGAGFGGNVAVGAAGNIVWLPTGNNKPSYTLDGGQTWAFCRFEGAEPENSGMRWHNQYSYQRIQLLADKQNPGTFYLYHVGNQIHDAASQRFRGFWKSVDGGANFSRKRKDIIGPIYGTDAFNCKLRMPPGKSPDLFFCVGDVDADDTHTNIGLFYSGDEGASWRSIAGVREPLDFAFGKPVAEGAYPAIYAWGGLSDVRGLHRCLNFDPSRPSAASWETIGRYPEGSLDNGTVMAADMQEFGLVYLGLGGSGLFRAVNDPELPRGNG
ncbi:MAG: hypothetical protein JNM03_02780 [Sphingopyxis sp.]|uniref:hypothetical protein n=1 Tax=Sphingopyxis sp. TaxID=1908224 RepID=UPI001A4552C0|nr:hypothetical protein [Sphingopyxis sp.]MBL9068899.1 hypothetical protein [Sphingopyxis sp.]